MDDENRRDGTAAESVTQLDFQQAMNDFRIMFPEIEFAVIEAVLRANNGAVDATIDQLLAMNTDYEEEKSRHESSTPPPPTYNQAVHSSPDESLIRPSPVWNSNVLAPLFDHTRILGVPLCNSRGWKPMLLRPLPSDFLRLERYRSSHPRQGQLLPSGRLMLQRMELDAKHHEDLSNPALLGQQQQVLDDERLAMILQNDEFVEALRSDQDFMESLASEQEIRKPPPQGANSVIDIKPLDEEAAFRERLRQMGKVPRKKLTHFARTFFRGKRLNFSPIGGASVKERSILCDQDEDWSSIPDQGDADGILKQRSQK